jgi:hypothetical protein
MDTDRPNSALTAPTPGQERTVEVELPELDRQREHRLTLKSPSGEIHFDADLAALTIGRQDDCSVMLSASCTSRVHARITRSKSGLFYLEDCSTNGTIVLGHGSGAAILRRGQRMPLTGSGYIGLGAVPHPTAAWTVRYRAS